MLIMLALAITSSIAAQESGKAAERAMKSKAYKQARKDAKAYARAGYYVAPGALPMEKQLEEAWIRQFEKDEKGDPMYMVASGNSVAETQTAAKLAANEAAKLELAGQISTSIGALIEISIANQQLNIEEAASVTEVVAGAKSFIAQELGRVLPLVEMYKTIGKNVEANVRLAYNYEIAFEVGKKVIRKKLEEKTEIVHEKLEKLMQF